MPTTMSELQVTSPEGGGQNAPDGRNSTRRSRQRRHTQPGDASQARSQVPSAKSESSRRRTPDWFTSFVESQPLERSFVLFGLVVSVTLVVIFGIDLAAGWPFQRASIAVDVTNVICGIGLAYLSWDAYKELL